MLCIGMSQYVLRTSSKYNSYGRIELAPVSISFQHDHFYVMHQCVCLVLIYSSCTSSPWGLRFLNTILSNRMNILHCMLDSAYVPLITLQASSEYTDEKVDLEVYLINGKKVTLKVEAFDRTDQVLEVSAIE